MWNLNANVELPVASLSLSDGITRLLWSQDGELLPSKLGQRGSDDLGKQLVAASGKGKISLFDVHMSLWDARPSDWEQLARYIASCSDSSELV